MHADGSIAADHLSPEIRLLLACARPGADADKQAAIEGVLAAGVDWKRFAEKAVTHGLAALAAQRLTTLAPGGVPPDILEALRAVIDDTRRRSQALFGELIGLLDALAREGIEAIPFKGPVLAMQAFGDLALRESRDLDFLVRDADLARTITVLDRIGYRRRDDLTEVQLALMHRLQGQEIIFGEPSGTAVEPHTRLTSLRMALDIDHDALWSRAERARILGHSLLMLSPEDTVLLLAIHGGKEMWWDLKWVADYAGYLASHPALDWHVLADRARAQGCLRMLLLASMLARMHLGFESPPLLRALAERDRGLPPIIRRVMANWEADDPALSPDNNQVSFDRLLLHDGLFRRAGYVARTVFLPGPNFVAEVPLPRRLTFAYVPIRLAHDLIGLPAWQLYQAVRKQCERLPYALTRVGVPPSFIPASSAIRQEIRRHRQLWTDSTRIVARAPGNAVAWNDLGDALFGLRRYQEAVGCYDKALSLVPNNAWIWRRRAAALTAAGGTDEAAPSAPEDTTAWVLRGEDLLLSRNYVEAIEASEHVLTIEPANPNAARIGIQARLWACDWGQRDADIRRVSQGIAAGETIIRSLFHRALSDSEAEHLTLARITGRGFMRPRPPAWQGEHYDHDRIRIAYCSTDFRDHVVSDVMAGCFEHHDRSRFHVTAISLGPDDGSAMRHRVAAAFDRFIDAKGITDERIAGIIRDLEIDIAIDLNGRSGEHRPGIFAHRPAPVQVTFLGYPGTTGLPFFDYILADRFVVPPEQQVHYAEQVIYLPNTMMPYDRTRRMSPNTPSRAEAGLPPAGFVFACHNHEYKLSPEMFDVWMRLLREVEGSILWLKALNPTAMINLRREAAAQDVAPERLIFAPRLARAEDHIARLPLADIVLDTRPYNAHATACDALWMGVPVVTLPGNTFASRVAASVLQAAGVPELIAESLADYANVALALARNPERLAATKAKLLRNRDTEPLFDTARFTRNLEAAYSALWQRQQAGLPPGELTIADSVPAEGTASVCL